jgi:thioredoxin reductase
MAQFCDIAIIGAGPYGLSLAAHARALGLEFRIFGKVLATWRDHMPKGMTLKSDGFASNLSSPDPASSLRSYCRLHNLAYEDTHRPISLRLFQEYSAWFQKQYVPMVEPHNIISLKPGAKGFKLILENGEALEARRVVMAVGVTHFASKPDVLEGLDGVSHSFDHHDLSRFKGQDVMVVGAGASAIDTAALLADAGADVRLMARAKEIHFHNPPDPTPASWLRAITYPASGIGPGWRSFFCQHAPRLFRRLPEDLRLRATAKHLGPAPGWFLRHKIEGRVPTLLGHEIEKAKYAKDRVFVTARGADGDSIAFSTGHVIAATGFKPDLRRLPFLDADLRARVDAVEHTPKLSDNFESSVPGLYMVGPLAANTFGPLMRFMVGAEYVAPRVAQHLCATARKSLKRSRAA